MTATPSHLVRTPERDAQGAYVAAYAALRRYGRRWATLNWVALEVQLRGLTAAYRDDELEGALHQLAADGLVQRDGSFWRAAA